MKISIVIPTFNEEKYLGRTLKSVQDLDSGGYEVETVIIDACSTDKTVEIAESYSARVVTIPHRGIGFARKKGIEKATGQIILSTDSDTVVPRNWLVTHVKALSEPNVVLSYGPFKVIDGTFSYRFFINYLQYYGWLLAHYIFKRTLATGQNTAFWKGKALLIGGYNDKLLIMEDLDFSLRMSTLGKTVYLKDLVVIASGRRSKEGWRFFTRTAMIAVQYFLLGKKNLGGFPDFR